MILLFYYLGFILTLYFFKSLKTLIIWTFNLNFNEVISLNKEDVINLVIVISLFMFSSAYLINAQSFLSIYLSMELQSFTILLALLLLSDNLAEGPEAVFKYFVISSIAGVMYLVGYYLCSFELNGHLNDGSTNCRNDLNLFILCVPFIVKLGLFPSYIWVPEVYRGLSYLGLAFISLIPKITSFLVIMKLSGPSQIFLAIGLVSIIISSFGGLNQSNIKVLLSFSGLGHFGLIFILISIGYSCYSLSSFYLIVYCLTASSLLFTLSFLKKNNIIELGGILSNSTALGFILSVLILSLLGFPPLSGFICKLVVIISSLLHTINTMIIIIMILSLVVSAFYYLRTFNVLTNNTESYYKNYKWVVSNNKLVKFHHPFFITWPVFLTFFLCINPTEVFLISSLIL